MGKGLNDYGYVLSQIHKLKGVLNALQFWLNEARCEFHNMMEDSYEEYCSNKDSEQFKRQQKVGWEFKPEQVCINCPLYRRRV
jgi:hypothetical protein